MNDITADINRLTEISEILLTKLCFRFISYTDFNSQMYSILCK